MIHHVNSEKFPPITAVKGFLLKYYMVRLLSMNHMLEVATST